MPRRNHVLTVELGTPPTGGWEPGLAVTANGNNAEGTMIVVPASAATADHIVGWTLNAGNEGDIAPLRTMIDGTVFAKMSANAYPYAEGGRAWLTNDGSGMLLNNFSEADQDNCAITLAPLTAEGWVEVLILRQKYITL